MKSPAASFLRNQLNSLRLRCGSPGGPVMRARSVIIGGNEDQQHDDRASDNPALPYATHMFDLPRNAVRYHGRAARKQQPGKAPVHARVIGRA